MPNYANGKIYKIVCNITGEQYIGGTIQKLSQRLTQHVSSGKKGKTFIKSKDIILRGDYQIVLIENYPCSNKEELERKEREHIEANICVNKCIPTRTQKEYRDAHKEEIVVRDKEYYNNHKEEIKSRVNAYYDTNKEVAKLRVNTYRIANNEAIKLKKKEYYNKNKESIALKLKEYRDRNRDEINRKQNERYQKKKQEKMDAVEATI